MMGDSDRLGSDWLPQPLASLAAVAALGGKLCSSGIPALAVEAAGVLDGGHALDGGRTCDEGLGCFEREELVQQVARLRREVEALKKSQEPPPPPEQQSTVSTELPEAWEMECGPDRREFRALKHTIQSPTQKRPPAQAGGEEKSLEAWPKGLSEWCGENSYWCHNIFNAGSYGAQVFIAYKHVDDDRTRTFVRIYGGSMVRESETRNPEKPLDVASAKKAVDGLLKKIKYADQQLWLLSKGDPHRRVLKRFRTVLRRHLKNLEEALLEAAPQL